MHFIGEPISEERKSDLRKKVRMAVNEVLAREGLSGVSPFEAPSLKELLQKMSGDMASAYALPRGLLDNLTDTGLFHRGREALNKAAEDVKERVQAAVEKKASAPPEPVRTLSVTKGGLTIATTGSFGLHELQGLAAAFGETVDDLFDAEAPADEEGPAETFISGIGSAG